MNEQDFNRIKEISKELNDIRLRNDLRELELRSEHQQFTHHEYRREWNEVVLITRGEHRIFDCKIVRMEIDKETNKITKEMEYDKYINLIGGSIYEKMYNLQQAYRRCTNSNF